MVAIKKAPSMRLKRAPKVTPAKDSPRLYFSQLGSPRSLNEPHSHLTDAAAKKAARGLFEDWREWAKRTNSKSVIVIDKAIAEIEALPDLTTEPVEVIYELDDYSGLTLMARLWKVNE